MWIVPSTLFEPQPVGHCQHELGDDFGGVFADAGGAQNHVECRGGVSTFTNPCVLAVGNRAVQVVETIERTPL